MAARRRCCLATPAPRRGCAAAAVAVGIEHVTVHAPVPCTAATRPLYHTWSPSCASRSTSTRCSCLATPAPRHARGGGAAAAAAGGGSEEVEGGGPDGALIVAVGVAHVQAPVHVRVGPPPAAPAPATAPARSGPGSTRCPTAGPLVQQLPRSPPMRPTPLLNLSPAPP